MQISLDTAGYRPEELAVKVEGGELVVRGSHEEKTQAGQVAVARAGHNNIAGCTCFKVS